MDKVSILHLITAAKNASPFDVNMAFDAGFDKIRGFFQRVSEYLQKKNKECC